MKHFLFLIFILQIKAASFYLVQECNAEQLVKLELDFFSNCFEANQARGMLYLYKSLKNKQQFIEIAQLFSKQLEKQFKEAKNRPLQNQLTLRILRITNNLHEQDSEVRFAIIKYLKPSTLLQTLITWRFALYTSSYNKLIDELLNWKQFEEKSLFEHLKNYSLAERATFIESLSAYNRMEEVFDLFNDLELEELARADINYLAEKPAIKNAVAWVEALANEALAKRLKKPLQLLFEELITDENVLPLSPFVFKEAVDNEVILTGLEKFILLMCNTYQLIKEEFLSDKCFGFSKNYPNYLVPEGFKKLDLKSLFDKQNRLTQRHIYFDDADGRSTLHYYLKRHSDLSKWEIDDKKEYLLIKSKNEKGLSLDQYLNKPEFQKTAPQIILNDIQEKAEVPTVFIFRGHSYHVTASIDYLVSDVRLAVIGSCGGFENLEKILSLAKETQVILTKGTGTVWINNLLIPALNNYALSGQAEINWFEFKSELRKSLEKSMANYAIKDYILDQFDRMYLFPHENIGFIMMHTWLEHNG